ncbi:hypothetical protein V8G54_037060 [Vigna mungo]|uniref:ABC transporter domain-containing protein n=1 Tax=Vigna mungo TaxID=3915 RepID=A0AAQ3MHV7_VIGMU
MVCVGLLPIPMKDYDIWKGSSRAVPRDIAGEKCFYKVNLTTKWEELLWVDEASISSRSFSGRVSDDKANKGGRRRREMKKQGVFEECLELLKGVSGVFRPGVLTALMGVSGAGKTTLMDVLAGRKTGGYIEGSITISGYIKRQETFARISGYCEQFDIHSPNVTVYESLLYSSRLPLPARKLQLYSV